MKNVHRRYAAELSLSIGAYAVLLIVSVLLLNRYPDSPLRVPLALAPMIPACFIPLVVMRLLSQIDELQRKIQLEALGFAFGGTAVLTFAYGFLQNVGFPQASWFFIWPIMAALWVLGLLLATQRYK